MNTGAVMRAVECVVAFFLIGLVGYYLTKRRWFSAESSALLTRLLTGVIIPVNLCCNINASATKADFLPILHYMFLPAASIVIVMFLAWLLLRAMPMEQSHRNIFIAACGCSNTINIGLPISLALFGTEALPGVLLYFMGNTTVFWTLGNYLLALDAPDMEKAPVLSRTTVKRIFSPPILGFLAGLTLLVCNVKLPPMISIAGSQLGGMTTPVSILCIGISICLAGLRNIRVSRDIVLVGAGRFVASPLVMLCLLHFFPVPEIMRNVFIIQASLPPMANIALMAIKYKADAAFASVTVSFLTLCALVTVPLFMFLLTAF